MFDDALLKIEIRARVERLQAAMATAGFDALIVYGNAKAKGSLTYLSGYFVDRTGWVSNGPTRDDVSIFDGAAVVVPARGEPVLLIESGHMVDLQPSIEFRGGGLTAGGGGGLTGSAVADVLGSASVARVGLENWDRFPLSLYLSMQAALPRTDFVESRLVEELRLTKSAYEVGIFEECGRVADAGHSAFVDALRGGVGKSELELVRIADHAMRTLNPIYEDAAPCSTSKICSGTSVLGCMLHTPLGNKLIERGDVVNWDICGQYRGYSIDTSRTRVVGAPSAEQLAAYDVALEMSRAVRAAMVPGAVTTDLLRLADDVARSSGFGLWEMFLGHGIGLDCHERPDMGIEELVLKANMVITVEPRIALDGRFLLANEDMVLVTDKGGIAFGSFPREPLALV